MAVGTLAVNLIARTSAFDRKMRSSRKRLDRFNRNAGIAAGRIAKMGAVAGIAAAVGLAYLIKSSMSTIDATAKMSDRLGMATEDLVAFRHAAEIAGSSAETFDKAIEIMVRRLGEVRMGVGQAKYALESMGLSADELVKKSPAEALEIIAKSISKLPTEADQLFAAYGMMGRKGMELVNLFQRIEKEGVKGIREEAERLCITFSRFDAAKVEAANDAITRMKAMFRGIVQTLAIELAPTIENIATGIVEWGTAGEGMKPKIIDALESMTLGLLEFGNATDAIAAKWNKFWAWYYNKLGAQADIAKWMTPLNFAGTKIYESALGETPGETFRTVADKWTREAEKNMASYTASVEKAKAAFEALRLSFTGAGAGGGAGAPDVFGDMFDKMEKWQEQLNYFGMTTREIDISKFQQLGAVLEEGSTNLETFNMILEEIIGLSKELDKLEGLEDLERFAEQIIESTRTPLEKYEAQIGKLGEALEKGYLNWEQYGRGVRQAKESLESSLESSLGGRIAGQFKAGEFKEIRKAFVSVSGLQIGGIDPMIKLAGEQLAEQRKTNVILERKEGFSAG